MVDGAPAILVALESSGLGGAIRQSRWIYMAANVGHIVSLLAFAGAIALMDVRLMGGLAATSPLKLLRAARIAAMAAFAGLVLTGALLFTAEASHVALNTVFQIKLALIALGLFNVAWVEWTIVPKLAAMPPLTTMPTQARFAGALSLSVWLAVAICGRAIAYF